MNKKDKVSIGTLTKRLILSNFLPVVTFAALVLIIAAVFCTFGMAYAQDLNPPTTGKTSPRTTLTFGPNIPGSANRSMQDNGTQGSMVNGSIDHANTP
jgi:hypothetical protein